MKILNLTQHTATPEQIAQGVFEPSTDHKQFIVDMLTFNELPTLDDLIAAVDIIAAVARCYDASHAMIGGAPFLMTSLEEALKLADIIPIYAFSKRESTEEALPDGSVKKVNIFKHAGFIGLDQ